MKAIERFEPALFSLEENRFIADHVGQSPMVALHGGAPAGVNPKAVTSALQRFFDLQQLSELRGTEWAGVEAIKEACEAYLVEQAKWTKAALRGAPYPPTMYDWDSRGRPHRGAVGSDAGIVRTYFDDEGNRVDLGVNLEVLEGTYVPEWIAKRKAKTDATQATELVEDQEKGLFTCPICSHTVNYESGVQSKRNVARAQMAKHLIKAKKEVESHRILYAAVFGSAT